MIRDFSSGKLSHVIAFIAFTTVAGCLSPSFGQTQDSPSREIVAEDFTKNRPKETSNSGVKTNRNAKKIYRLASKTSSTLKASPLGFQQLGITLWRLRPVKPGDSGARIQVREDTNSSDWVPERIEAATPINYGDRVRVTFESPRTGYLYIIDRDLFADGSMGDAMLIFPTLSTRGGDNEVRAGKLIDIPAVDDRQSYFTARPVRNDQVGELLSIIVTSKPLNLPVANQPLKLETAHITQWETAWAAPAERFEMVGGAGQTWTENEKLAAAAEGTRQLTQDGPAPQTIYRLLPKRHDGVLVNLRLNYRSPDGSN